MSDHFCSYSSQQMCLPSCHTCMQLLSYTLPTNNFSLGFQSKSTTLERCPLCLYMKGFSSYLIYFEISHKSMLRPCPQDPKIHELKGLHCTLITLSFSALKVTSDLVRFLKSHTETFQSADPLASKNSLKGEKSREQTQSVCPTTSKIGFFY